MALERKSRLKLFFEPVKGTSAGFFCENDLEMMEKIYAFVRHA